MQRNKRNSQPNEYLVFPPSIDYSGNTCTKLGVLWDYIWGLIN